MQRAQELAADDEDGLLALQEQFARGETRPAAKVTRVSQKPAATAAAAASEPPPPAACPEHGPACSGHHHAGSSDAAGPPAAADLMAAMQAAMHNIVGNVQERQPAPPKPPPPPPAAGSDATAAFPQATHRKASKFALGRQRQRTAGGGVAVSEPVGPAAAAAPPAAAAQGGAPADEARIDAENQQLLAAMTPEQLAEAREEALQRLPPATVEFLRKRGLARAAAAAAAAQAGSAAPAPPPDAAQQAAAAAAPPAAAGASRPAPAPRQPRGQLQAAPAPASTAGGPQAGVAARLRFDVDGTVAGLRPAGSSTDVSPAEVAQRDPLRQEGDGGGYSLAEACLLARSTVQQQRVLALRLLGAVLAFSRPRLGGAASGGRVPLPADVAAALQAEGGEAAQAPDWAAVWRHALHAADVVLLLRRSLDDANIAVAAAAADALTALLGAAGPASAPEEASAEAGDACPLTGWPAPPLRHLQRPLGGAGWVAAPAAPRQGEIEEGEEEEDLDEKQLARVDPLTGLLHMQLLRRAAYLLGPGRAAAAVDPLLSILVRCCQAGRDVADQVAETPGMLDALKSVLDAPPPPAAGAALDAAAAAYHAAQPKALRLLRQLAEASKGAARLLQEAGLVRFAYDQLLRPAGLSPSAPITAGGGGSGGGGGGSLKQHGQLCEALRLWRCYAQHGLYLAHLDDAYPALCTYLTPSPPASGGAVASSEALQRWCVAREAYSTAARLCWHAASCEAGEAQLSPQCAAALAAGALGWLAGLPLQQLLEACTDGRSGGGQGAPAAAARLSPYPALTAALDGDGASQQAVLLSTLAAALHFVAAYWSVQVWHTAADKAAAAEQLAAAGLLPPAGGGGGSMPAALQTVRGILEQLVSSDAIWQAPSASTAAAAVASAELAAALARLAATFLQQPQAAAASASLLAPLCSQQAAARFLQAAVTADATLLQPWDAARQQQLVPLARAAAIGLQAAARAGGDASALPAPAADAALALLRLLPPGDESVALQLLGLLLQPQHLAAVEAAASAAFSSAGSKVAELAADTRAGAAAADGPPAMPDTQHLSAVLLAGYAAPWLGLVPEQAAPGEAAAAGRTGTKPPPTTAVLRPQGSRLPLPLDWALAELPLPPAEAGVSAGPGHAAEGALVLALGWEAQGLRSLSAVAAAAAAAVSEHQLRSAVLLLFGEQQQSAGVVPGGALGTIQEDEDDEAVWQQPAARWCLAALMDRFCSSAAAAAASSAAAARDSNSSGLRGWQAQEARELAHQFAAASYGDRLFGAAVATLLRQSVPLDVQLEVLATLADEQALHLLPPLRLLPGPPSAYLDSPLSAGGGSFGRACFGAAPGGSPAGSSGREEMNLCVRLLTDGPLERCLAADDSSSDLAAAGRGSSEGDGASIAGCSAAVPVTLQRVARGCFPDAAPGGAAASERERHRQQGLLCTVLQRCCGSGARPELQRLLGMLLRWDATAGRPSDAISQQRLAAVEAACSTVGIPAPAALAALDA